MGEDRKRDHMPWKVMEVMLLRACYVWGDMRLEGGILTRKQALSMAGADAGEWLKRLS